MVIIPFTSVLINFHAVLLSIAIIGHILSVTVVNQRRTITPLEVAFHLKVIQPCPTVPVDQKQGGSCLAVHTKDNCEMAIDIEIGIVMVLENVVTTSPYECAYVRTFFSGGGK